MFRNNIGMEEGQKKGGRTEKGRVKRKEWAPEGKREKGRMEGLNTKITMQL